MKQNCSSWEVSYTVVFVGFGLAVGRTVVVGMVRVLEHRMVGCCCLGKELT